MRAHVLPLKVQPTAQDFRDTRYWNEECDNFLKMHQTLFENVYNSQALYHRESHDALYDGRI